MPLRVLIAILVAVVAVALGAALLLPGDDEDGGGAVAAPGSAPGGGGSVAVAVPPVAAVAGAPPVAAVDPAPIMDTTLAADLAALATARSTGIGTPAADGAGLVEVVAVDNRITFALKAPINAGEYELEAERAVIVPGLDAFTCDDGACFEVAAAAVEQACVDPELGALLRRGAVVRYRYVDLAGADLGDVTIAAANCEP